eukprot:jgi/Chlat1/1206/Chrsp115S00739
MAAQAAAQADMASVSAGAKLPAIADVASALSVSEEVALFVTIGFAALLGAVLLLLITLSNRSSGKADSILIVGLMGAGKTALFSQLRDGTVHNGTVTSLDKNEGRFILNSEKVKAPRARPVHVVDLPGHPRLQLKAEPYIGSARGIVFVIDAVELLPNSRSIAERMYELLTNRSIHKRRIPLLVACNKMDNLNAHTVEFIRKRLEKELDQLRSTKNTLSEASTAAVRAAGSSSGEVYLGSKTEAFKFSQLPNKVSFAETSVAQGNIADVERFIRERIRP